MKRVRTLIMACAVSLLAAGAGAQETEPQGPPTKPEVQSESPPPMPTAGDKFVIPSMTGDAAAGQPTEVIGSVAIQAVQGTPGGDPIGAAKIELMLFHRGSLYDTIEAELDEHGVVVLEDLPVNLAFTPVVNIEYAGVTYQRVGAEMNAENPQQKIDVTCYDVTDEAPDWKVQMRHVRVLGREEGGVRVKETFVLVNPDEQTWIGNMDTGMGIEGRGVTTVFALPEGASEVDLGQGFHDWCCTAFEEGRLVNHLPLMPQNTQLSFTYHLPATDGSAKVDIVAPATVDGLAVFAPADMTVEAAEGLESGGVQQMGDLALQFYHASNVPRGQLASLTLTGITGAPAAGLATSADGSTMGTAKIIAAIGGGLIVVIALIIIFSRSAKPAADT